MLRSRIIPCLLIHQKGLVKSVRFSEKKYVGDPINAVKIFNEKEVDELIVLDIDASVQGRGPDYTTIRHLAAECRMPFCYGGGIRTVEQAIEIITLGVEKVALSSGAIETPELVTKVSDKIGGQSVVVVLDVKKNEEKKYEVWTHNGTKNTHKSPVQWAVEFEALGAGEIVINSIDKDGMMNGYDEDLVRAVHEVITIPLTALGGAGSHNDLKDLIATFIIPS